MSFKEAPRVRYFNLEFNEEGEGASLFAAFPFYFEGVPVSGVSCVISGRRAGNMGLEHGMEESPARLALFERLGLDYSRAAFLKQIHSRKVLETEGEKLWRGTEADGLVSGDKSVILCVTAADCLPVFLLDTKSGVLGLLHSGWKGTGIVLEALSLMKEKFGTRPEETAAVLGPCIGPCCYRVDEERARAFESEWGGGSFQFAPVTIKKDGFFYLDLRAANIKLLSGAGVRNIAACEDCTFMDGRLGSFRREGRDFTRMLAVSGYFRAPGV